VIGSFDSSFHGSTSLSSSLHAAVVNSSGFEGCLPSIVRSFSAKDPFGATGSATSRFAEFEGLGLSGVDDGDLLHGDDRSSGSAGSASGGSLFGGRSLGLVESSSVGSHASGVSSSSSTEGSHLLGMSSSSGLSLSDFEGFKGSSSSDGKHSGLVGSDSGKMGTSGSSLGSGSILGSWPPSCIFLGSKYSGSEGLHLSGMSDSLEVGSTSFGSKGLGLGDSDGFHASGMCGSSSSKGSHSSGMGSTSLGSEGFGLGDSDGVESSGIALSGDDLVQLGAPVSDGVVSGTAPLLGVMDSTGEVSSVVTLLSESTVSTPKTVLVVVGHAFDLSVSGTSHGSTESTVAFPGGSFTGVNVSSGGMSMRSLAEAVFDNSTDGITEGSVVTVLPSSGVSVRPFASSSVSDLTLAVTLSSSSSGVFTTTLLPLSSINGGLGELGGSHGGSDEGHHNGELSHIFVLFY